MRDRRTLVDEQAALDALAPEHRDAAEMVMTGRTADKRLRTVRFWGRCGLGGQHEGVPCRNCGQQPD